MSEAVIHVEGLGKRYRIGGPRAAYGTLRDTIASAARVPFEALRGQRVKPVEFWALSEVSFDVAQGEALGVVGRNGAGKTTLLKILAKVTHPTTGRAVVSGRVGSLLDVGTGFHPELTGRENIYLNGAVLGMKRAEIQQKFDEIVAFADIQQFLDVPVKRYSTGMYMRLAFSVAAHLEPEILIVDEVLAVGDAAFQKRCLGKMRTITRQGRTVILVSHNMAAIRNLCSSAIVLDRGELVDQGSARHCIASYARRNAHEAASSWTRPHDGEPRSLMVTEAKSRLTEQPQLTLDLELLLESTSAHKPAFIAVDVLDSSGAILMQALPRADGFIYDSGRHHRVGLEIELPPLIPGQYLLTVWVGSHHTETLDEVSEAVAFEVHDSPTEGRTYPHSADHGRIVPRSTVRIHDRA